MKPYRVCVVDDDEENAALLCEGLKLHGYDAVACFRGADALACSARGEVDLVLLDVCLPDIDGHEVCRRIKESPQTSKSTLSSYGLRLDSTQWPASTRHFRFRS